MLLVCPLCWAVVQTPANWKPPFRICLTKLTNWLKMLAQFVLINPRLLLMLQKPSKKLCVLTSASTTWLLPTRSNPCEKMAHSCAIFFCLKFVNSPLVFHMRSPCQSNADLSASPSLFISSLLSRVGCIACDGNSARPDGRPWWSECPDRSSWHRQRPDRV